MNFNRAGPLLSTKEDFLIDKLLPFLPYLCFINGQHLTKAFGNQ